MLKINEKDIISALIPNILAHSNERTWGDTYLSTCELAGKEVVSASLHLRCIGIHKL